MPVFSRAGGAPLFEPRRGEFGVPRRKKIKPSRADKLRLRFVPAARAT